MLADIILRDIRHNIFNLRLHIALTLIIAIFSFGTIAFVKNYRTDLNEYNRYQTDLTEQMRERAESNLTSLTVKRWDYILGPRPNTFISDAREKYLPNDIKYNGYNVFGFNIRPGNVNPYLNTFQELNWAFIVSIILSFTVFLLTFDSISGEKEAGTLVAGLSNSLSRGTLLLGKYFSTIITALLVLLPGICLSLIILLIAGTIQFNALVSAEIVTFLLVSVLFVACIAAFGLLSSVLAGKANVSLLVALTIWLVFVVVIPNTALFWTQTLFPIEKSEDVQQRINMERSDINKNAPPGSWSSSGNNPFLPQHELRANNQTNLMNAETNIRNAYYGEMFRQYERARFLTCLSPLSLFEYITESIVGGGYVRFQKVWSNLKSFQAQFLAFFKEIDAKDEDSPHWYNPYENFSTTKKPVSFEQVPLFEEKAGSPGDRFSAAGLYLLLMTAYAAIAFLLTLVLFSRYDVR